ncbi:hypothetical protein C8R43DRAFT_1124171 [Mycena crocata]|nr:hypothetical protein C8R43DRAFT_1124171 [Mycena crocata]
MSLYELSVHFMTCGSLLVHINISAFTKRKSILNIGRAIHTIKYEDCTQQCVFLDEKVALMELYSPFIAQIAADVARHEVPHQIKNSYHQTAIYSGGVIAGKYPQIVDFCNRLKNECDRACNGILLNQQIHRAKLNDVCAYIKEEKEAVHSSEEAKRKEREKAKAKKARARRAQEVDEGSVIDDKDMPPLEPSSEVNNPMIMNNSEMLNSLETMHDNGCPLSTQSMDDHILVRVPSMATLVMDNINGMIDPSSLLEEFPVSTLVWLCILLLRLIPPKEARSLLRSLVLPPHGNGLEEAANSLTRTQQFQASELAVNDRVKVTVSAASSACSADDYPATINSLRLEESDVQSHLSFANAQLRYHLDHYQYLLDDLHRILDAQHQHSKGVTARG